MLQLEVHEAAPHRGRDTTKGERLTYLEDQVLWMKKIERIIIQEGPEDMLQSDSDPSIPEDDPYYSEGTMGLDSIGYMNLENAMEK